MSFERCEVEFMGKIRRAGAVGRWWGEGGERRGEKLGWFDGWFDRWGGWIGKDRKGQEEREIGKGSDKGNE